MYTKTIFHEREKLNLHVFEGESDYIESIQHLFSHFNTKGIKKELSYFSNTPDKIWFILCSEYISIGFAALTPRKNRIEFNNLYVVSECRGSGYGGLLIDLRLDYAKPWKKTLYTVLLNDVLIHAYTTRGFTEYRKTKNCTFMRKECTE